MVVWFRHVTRMEVDTLGFLIRCGRLSAQNVIVSAPKKPMCNRSSASSCFMTNVIPEIWGPKRSGHSLPICYRIHMYRGDPAPVH